MPIYEYKCDKCDEVSEYIVKNSDVKVECKKCGHKKMTRRVSTGTNFKLMGEGWTGQN